MLVALSRLTEAGTRLLDASRNWKLVELTVEASSASLNWREFSIMLVTFLILFAVMLTAQIENVRSRPSPSSGTLVHEGPLRASSKFRWMTWMGAKLTWHGLADESQWAVRGKLRSFAPVISRLARPPYDANQQSRERTMDFGLKNRRALVMGGTKGLGRSIADWQAAYYDRPAALWATYQRVLCNKCHAKD